MTGVAGVPVVTADSALLALVGAGARSAAPLALAWLVTRCLRRRSSAATRHIVWFAAVGLALLLPVVSAVVPAWRVGLLPPTTQSVIPAAVAPTDTEQRPVSRTRSVPFHTLAATPAGAQTRAVNSPAAAIPTARPASRSDAAMLARIAIIIWATVAAIVLAIGAAARVALWRIERMSKPEQEGPLADAVARGAATLRLRRWVRVLTCGHAAMPMTWGTLRPRLLLPAEARRWPARQLRDVVLHELAHVKRLDTATQAIARLACALYWFNPLAWLAARHLRTERELACDDVVVTAGGAEPASYAEHLLAVARTLRWGRLVDVVGVSMGRPPGLKSRLTALLATDVRRSAAGRRVWIAMLAASLVLGLPLAALRLGHKSAAAAHAAEPVTAPATRPATTAASTMRLQVLDPDGKPIPGVRVELAGSDPDERPATATDGTVAVPLPTHPQGDLRITVKAAGFVQRFLEWGYDQRSSIPATYTLRMERGVTIGGKVVDDAGTPVAGAHVAYWAHVDLPGDGHDAADVRGSVTTATDGTWTADHLPAQARTISAGTWDYRYANGDEYGMAEWPLSDARERKPVLRLRRGVPIEGTVVDAASGKPIAGASVLTGDDVGSDRVPAQKTSADGSFAYVAEPGERVTLTVSAEGYAMELTQVTMGKGPKRDVKVALSRGKPMTGRVIGPDGHGVAGAWIFPDTWRGVRSIEACARTDADGRFVWNGAPLDTVKCDVDAMSQGLLRLNGVPLKVGEANVVQLPPAIHVTVNVLDADTGKPVEGASLVRGLWFGPDQPGGWWEMDQALQTDRAGTATYWIRWSYAGYFVRVTARGYAPAQSDVFKNDRSQVALEVRLKPREERALKVMDPDGTPATAARGIVATQEHTLKFGGEPTGGVGLPEWADSAGVVRYPPQERAYALVLYDSHGYRELDETELQGKTEVTLQPWGGVRGRLTLGDLPGRDLPLEMFKDGSGGISDWSPVDYRPSLVTDADGRFSLSEVPPGKYRVQRRSTQATGDGARSKPVAEAVVEVKAGQTAEVTLNAQAGGK